MYHLFIIKENYLKNNDRYLYEILYKLKINRYGAIT